MKRIRLLLKLLRPHQWIKSSFVFVGLLFGHAWSDPALVRQVVMAAAGFSLAASAIYVMNDLTDREQDRVHPEKRNRPLASGAVRPLEAVLLGAICLCLALALAFAASTTVLCLILAYVALNVGYSQGLKHVVLLDVFIIAAGFMLRILAGTQGVGIAPSQWLLLCGLMVTLFLGFSKRRAELNALDGKGVHHRAVLDDYDPVLLDKLIGISAAAAIISYSLYTVSADTVAMHGTNRLIYTVPFVVYGIFRYLFLLHRRGGGGDAAAAMLRDRHLFGAVGCWLLTVIVLLA